MFNVLNINIFSFSFAYSPPSLLFSSSSSSACTLIYCWPLALAGKQHHVCVCLLYVLCASWSLPFFICFFLFHQFFKASKVNQLQMIWCHSGSFYSGFLSEISVFMFLFIIRLCLSVYKVWLTSHLKCCQTSPLHFHFLVVQFSRTEHYGGVSFLIRNWWMLIHQVYLCLGSFRFFFYIIFWRSILWEAVVLLWFDLVPASQWPPGRTACLLFRHLWII